MIGQPLRNAAFGRHNIHILVTLILALERDERAVGRKNRSGFHAGAGRQAHRFTALARHAPQIARVRENDVGFVDGGVLQQKRLIRSEHADKKQERQQNSEHTGLLERYFLYYFGSALLAVEEVNEEPDDQPDEEP